MTDASGDHLAPTWFIDSDSAAVRDFVHDVVGTTSDLVEQVLLLFAAVRDRIWYDPFTCSDRAEDYRASAVVDSTRNWCVPKAVLLTAAARAVGVPAQLGFADVRNHFQTPRLRDQMGGTDLFVFHGYSALYLRGRWLKATPAFNAELCARFGVAPIEFDGTRDALLHEHDARGGTYMEYLRDRGTRDDLPLVEMLTTFREVYGDAITITGTRSHESDEFTAPSERGGKATFLGQSPIASSAWLQ